MYLNMNIKVFCYMYYYVGDYFWLLILQLFDNGEYVYFLILLQLLYSVVDGIKYFVFGSVIFRNGMKFYFNVVGFIIL